MSRQIYALLVGINDYPPNVGKLTGCVNDVDHFHDYLTDTFDRKRLQIEVLKDADATRGNVIAQFRSHLGKAVASDVALFQYCGHGARWKSASDFFPFFPDGMDEGLVCIDSRNDGGFDLADKELAILIAELAKNHPHIAVILDSCHSGSATRGSDDFTLLRARQTHERSDERPLESYLDGYYAELKRKGERLEIPAGRHILLSACQRIQKAWETKDHSGVFTSTLLDVLRKSEPNVAYADLFVRCRAAVRERADNQDPQFETYHGFNAYSGFLGGEANRSARRYSTYFTRGAWQVDCGAIHGLPGEADKITEFALYDESNPSLIAGHATTIQVGAQKSQLQLQDLSPDVTTRYVAEITSLPVAPLMVFLDGDSTAMQLLQSSLAAAPDKSSEIAFLTEAPTAICYALHASPNGLQLVWRDTSKLIQATSTSTTADAAYLLDVLKRIADWQRASALQNQATWLNPDDVQFQFCEALPDKKEHIYTDSEITLDIRREDNAWTEVCGKFIANNLSIQPLYFALVHLSDSFGVSVLYKERIEPVEEFFTLTPMGESVVHLFLDETDGDEVNHTFKLIVTTEEVDDFLLGQDPLEIGKTVDAGSESGSRGLAFGDRRRKRVYKNEWFTKDLRIRLVRQLDSVTSRDAMLAGGKIRIKGHSSLTAAISISSVTTASRGASGHSDFSRALERQGMQLLNFSGTRGDVENVLELTDIRSAESLSSEPLEIELDVDLQLDEFILPLTFDGEHILLTGNPSRDESGRALISISRVPEIPDNRRSLGSALKLYFFKTWLKRENLNQLCWIEYKSDGTFERHRSGVSEKVSAAKNVLLLIHGIIGDTDGMAHGLSLSKDAEGKGVNQKFDLVLTYDYENLSTSISETAVALKQQLAEAGLREGDDKRLTLLVHSMGGLVSRWFIEREGGNRIVDHLVMFGTPNVGSPFGVVDSARTVSAALTTLAINTIPALAPFGGALIYLLNRSRKLTPTLEQMNPTSEFIKTLNRSPDPGITYTIIAGDIRDYKESADQLIAKLVAKVGTGIVFDAIYQNSGHDIAVSDQSICGVPDDRSPAPVKRNAICHHLNYFVSEAGLKALADLPL